jgi:hypothetical protein
MKIDQGFNKVVNFLDVNDDAGIIFFLNIQIS